MDLEFFLIDKTSAVAPSVVRVLPAICGRRDRDPDILLMKASAWQKACCNLEDDSFFLFFIRAVA